jgi:hypothetical protein
VDSKGILHARWGPAIFKHVWSIGGVFHFPVPSACKHVRVWVGPTSNFFSSHDTTARVHVHVHVSGTRA